MGTNIHKHNGVALGCVKLPYGFVSEYSCSSVHLLEQGNSVGDAGRSERVGVTRREVQR